MLFLLTQIAYLGKPAKAALARCYGPASGGGGNNQMTITNGGRVDAADLRFGYSDNNTLTVTGSNSLFSTANSSLFCASRKSRCAWTTS